MKPSTASSVSTRYSLHACLVNHQYLIKPFSPQPKGIPRRLTPKLQAIREEVRDGGYTLVLSFATSPDMTLEMWETRLDKIQSFFGPGITATLDKVDQGVDVALTADGSGAGRGGGQQQEVLPPLMPGLAPRVVNKQ